MRTLFFIIRYMKILSLVVVTFILIGCMGTSKDIKKAESLFIQFKCTNIESTQIPHSSLNSYYEQSLYSSKKNAELTNIESYKRGDKLFDISLHEVVEQQYVIYKEACQSLGGISKSE
ncbi:hypothetical protein [Acinetobacter faecalis]|uniref:Lipoprotein n=1 Tax=Acinetobacter faecalis TaxID=2665161 RepID=A0ABU5GMG4_9GAMM|nr:hypothetical protein [Acinetobacter faecalis]MDY6551543.1 hypothetical protein [Acinetobacter faecalis]